MASKLRLWIKAEGLTLRQFAIRIGVAGASVSRFCDGLQMPSRAVMRRIVFETRGEIIPNDFYDLWLRSAEKCPAGEAA